jgi:alkylhydroperoxidase/carboxymuconolactone decarboxylase family protein YurZ
VDSDVTRARRVVRLAEAALAQVDAARRSVQDLLDELGTSRAEPGSAGPGVEVGLDSARLLAIEMAVAGRSREEVGVHVRAAYEVVDVEALLDDVFGPRVAHGRA